MRRSFGRPFVVGVLVIGIVLSGAACASEEAPRPAVDVTASPAPVPGADPLTTVTTIVLRPETLELTNAAGSVVTSLPYDLPPEKVVDALSVVIGGEPSITPFAAGLEAPAGVTYSWTGLRLTDFLPTEGKFPGYGDFQLDVTRGVIGDGVGIETAAGKTVGHEIIGVAKELGLGVDVMFVSAGYAFLLVDVGPELATPAGENVTYPNAWAVRASSDSASGVIDHISAPVNLSHWVS
jgi:hypothetical protein